MARYRAVDRLFELCRRPPSVRAWAAICDGIDDIAQTVGKLPEDAL